MRRSSLQKSEGVSRLNRAEFAIVLDFTDVATARLFCCGCQAISDSVAVIAIVGVRATYADFAVEIIVHNTRSCRALSSPVT